MKFIFLFTIFIVSIPVLIVPMDNDKTIEEDEIDIPLFVKYLKSLDFERAQQSIKYIPVNMVDTFKQNCLHTIVPYLRNNWQESVKIIELLLKNGENPNQQNFWGRTPVHFLLSYHARNLVENNSYSKQQCFFNIFKLLTQYCADFSLADNDGVSVFSRCKDLLKDKLQRANERKKYHKIIKDRNAVNNVDQATLDHAERMAAERLLIMLEELFYKKLCDIICSAKSEKQLFHQRELLQTLITHAKYTDVQLFLQKFPDCLNRYELALAEMHKDTSKNEQKIYTIVSKVWNIQHPDAYSYLKLLPKELRSELPKLVLPELKKKRL